METNADLSQIPVGWELFSISHPEYRNFKQAYWCAFAVYLDRNLKVIPKTISNYLTGTIWFLQNVYFIDTNFTKSPIVQNTMKGITNLWRAQVGNKESDRRRLGVPLEVVLHVCNNILTKTDLSSRCAKLFFKLAFQLLARKSELLYAANNKHFLKVENVNFTFYKNNTPDVELSVTCLQIQSLNLTTHTLLSVQIEIKDAKNDQQGDSHRYSFDVRPKEIDQSKTYCIASDCLEWVTVSVPTNGRFPFLSHLPESVTTTSNNTQRAAPKEETLRNTLRTGAKALGLDPIRVTLHSLRIGAATTLAAAGASDYTIKQAGRWASDCYQRYVRDTAHMNAKVTDFLLNANAYTVSHVKKWCVEHDIKNDAIFDEDD